MLISRFTNVARFGLMHMIATNLCIWLYVLVEESKHELLEESHPTEAHSHHELDTSTMHGLFQSTTAAGNFT